MSAPVAPVSTNPMLRRPRLTGLSVLLRVVDVAAQAVVVIALLGELALVMLNIVARVFFSSGFLWTDEVARLTLATLTFVGGAVAYRRREHTSVRSLIDRLPMRWRPTAIASGHCVVLIGAVVAGLSSLTLVETSWTERTPILAMPAAVLAMPLTAAMVLIVLFAAERLWQEQGSRALLVAFPFAAALAILNATYDLWMPFFADDRAILRHHRAVLLHGADRLARRFRAPGRRRSLPVDQRQLADGGPRAEPGERHR